MKRLKIILQSNLFLLILIIATIVIITIRILTPSKTYYTPKDNKVIGTIKKRTLDNEKVTLLIKAKEKIQGTYYFKSNQKNKVKDLKIGDKVKVLGTITKPRTPTTKNLFDYSFYLKKQGIYQLITINEIKIIKSSTKLFDRIKNILNKKATHPYMQAFLLGNDEKIEEEVRLSYQENGISHLLAISGMQFYLIANTILRILKKIKVHKKTSYLITFIIIFLYFFVLDLNASILRGVLFFFLFSINKVWRLNLPKNRLIVFSIIITMLINPYFITEAAFWYSFIISIGLLSFFQERTSYWKSLWYSSVLSFLLSIPISLYYFYQVNVLSIVYNLFYIPYVNIVVFPLTIIAFLIPIIEPLYQLSITILEQSSLLLSKIKIGKFIFPKVNIFIYFMEFLFLLVYLKKKQKKVLIILITLFLGHYLSSHLKQDFIKMIDVGQGDSLLIYSQGKTALIDTGGKLRFDGKTSTTITKYTTIPLLKSLGIKKLDFLFLTHGDMDHMGEVFYLINHFKAEKIYINLGPTSLLENNLLKERKVAESKQDSVFQVGNFRFYQLNKSWKDENNSSSVYYVHHPNLTVLLMGDATIDTEKYLLENYNLNIDVLKVGHHGSKTSTGISFLNATSPRLALISVGQDNNFGHPNQEVLKKLENKNIPYLMTKDSGTITVFPNTEVIIEDKKLE